MPWSLAALETKQKGCMKTFDTVSEQVRKEYQEIIFVPNAVSKVDGITGLSLNHIKGQIQQMPKSKKCEAMNRIHFTLYVLFAKLIAEHQMLQA